MACNYYGMLNLKYDEPDVILPAIIIWYLLLK